jgi:transcriptional regulator with XRE-family HTH domain
MAKINRKDIDPPAVGRLLAELRKGAGMTQAEAAKASGISQAFWSLTEGCLVAPKIATLRAMFKAVGYHFQLGIKGIVKEPKE